MDGGLMDKFVQFDGDACTPPPMRLDRPGHDVMGYYDGNTVTALWNYAQHFAMSDNSFGTTYGPSTPGALNLISGQTHGATPADQSGDTSNGTRRRRPRPRLRRLLRAAARVGDDTARTSATCSTAPNSRWGWFEGGFTPSSRKTARPSARRPTRTSAARSAPTTARTTSRSSTTRSTANPHHLPPRSVADDRPHRPGQPPVRPERLLGRRCTTATCRRSAS